MVVLLANSIVRITGGLVVSYFQYSSDIDLHHLMETDGTAEVIREMATK